MKALTVKMERYIELKQKLTLDSKFKPNIYDLVDFDVASNKSKNNSIKTIFIFE